MNFATPESALHNRECLPDLLLAQSRAHADRVAVRHGGDTLTFHEFTDAAAALGRYLRSLGIGPDDGVGLFAEPSIDLMTDVWGILFAGGAYLPLSTEYPDERLRYMIEDARLRVVVTQDALRPRLEKLVPAGASIVTPEDLDRTRPSGDLRPGTGLCAHHLAYFIYTSGSTGKPKAVMIEHRSVVNQLRWLHAEHGLNEDMIVLQKTPISFDAAQWELLAPACGSTVVMGDPGIHRDPGQLIETVTNHRVTALQCVPTLLRELVNTEQFAACDSLRRIFSGGETLSAALARQCLQTLPHCDLVNLYGPTECTINSSALTVDPAALGEGSDAVPIGSPVANTRYHILDETGKPAAPGQAGELYIGGVQVARGYLNRPDLTADRFVGNPLPGAPDERLFRTGDLACWNADGTAQFLGRADNQVKLRGFRVELDEIRLAIETHDWIKNAAVFVKDDPRTGFQNLIACVELNPKEAALMDQGNHGAHHQSKESRLQVKVQLSNPGCRDADDLRDRPAIDLPGRTATWQQRRLAFARKTYRFFDGGDVTAADLLRLLGRRPSATASRDVDTLDLASLGEILRWFGEFRSDERLLPKYAYASPGSLYATQLYLELDGFDGLAPGYYYYHPVEHRLVLISRMAGRGGRRVRLHFVGKKRAIEPVYKNNIQEVLEIETGHMVGLFDEILPRYGLGVVAADYTPSTMAKLKCFPEDCYLGSFELVPHSRVRPNESVDVYVQAHPGRIADLPAGQYRYHEGRLHRISDELILKRHVIAINQQVYQRSSCGITVVGDDARGWLGYVDLGRQLHRFQANEFGLGFMSSGYSSESGSDLPSAKQIDRILGDLGLRTGPSYFFIGGRVSEEQIRSEGMKEDIVHMRGPAELLRDDLAESLPDHMIPNKVFVLDELPLTANGKVDLKALAASDKVDLSGVDRPVVAPRTATEQRIADIWRQALRLDVVSVQDNFFEVGGNSLIAVRLVNRLNAELGVQLPLQVLFECSTVEQLAHRVEGSRPEAASRLVALADGGSKPPVYCWPGLGGYPMSLRLLASRLDVDRPFYGVQAHGINNGEIPLGTITEMAAEDVRAIRRVQPNGPYTLLGYSFGARVAFETAFQLEQSGERVENLLLVAPGSPKVWTDEHGSAERVASYQNPTYLAILFSVFAGNLTNPRLNTCLATVSDEDSFVSFVTNCFPGLDADLVRNIVRVVSATFEFSYSFQELRQRRIAAPTAIFKATGDDYSFIENSIGYSSIRPVAVQLEADHYSLLKEPDIEELVVAIHRHLGIPATEGRVRMPHVNIKHFPVSLSDAAQSNLVDSVSRAVASAFGVDEGMVSIMLEPVDQNEWDRRVYVPEIVNRRAELCKVPNY